MTLSASGPCMWCGNSLCKDADCLKKGNGLAYAERAMEEACSRILLRHRELSEERYVQLVEEEAGKLKINLTYPLREKIMAKHKEFEPLTFGNLMRESPHAKIRENNTASDLANPNTKQVGGDHYVKQPIQPWDFIAANNIGFLEGNAIKYLSRWKEKGGVQDIEKALHYIEKLLEVERAKV